MSSTAQSVCARTPARFALLAIGFSGIIAQIVLMRELLIAAYGNEISLAIILAVWLLWTAIGSSFLSRLFSRVSATRVLSALLAASSIGFFAAIVMVRASRTFWRAQPGEALGPVPILVTVLFTLLLFSPISGWLFTAGTRLYSQANSVSIAQAGTSMYLLEAAGSAIGGLLASIVLIRFFNSLQIATIVAGVNLFVAMTIVISNRIVLRWLSALVILPALLLVFEGPRLDRNLFKQTWRGLRIVATSTSPYGSLVVVDGEGNRSVFQNGTALFTAPDQASAEEAVHFALLEHPAPRSVLLVGGGWNGSLEEIMKYRSVRRIDYVELDPEVIQLGRKYFATTWTQLASDSRVHLHELDGRLFIKNAGQHFDVIILNLPEPHTAQLNRFYTVEFFDEVSSHLESGGVFAFQIRASEEYLSPQMEEFLRCLNATMRDVFADVVIIPGETMHFVASQQKHLLTTDPQLLLERLRERDIRTTFVREYYLPYRLSADRVAAVQAQLTPDQQTPGTRRNRDFTPVAYFFNLELWSTQFSSRYREVFRFFANISLGSLFAGVGLIVLVMSSLLTMIRTRSVRLDIAVGSAVAGMGLSVMSSEILLLLGFQAIYGYLFDELALIISAFMIGMAAGSWLGLRQSTSSCSAREAISRALLLQIAAAAVLLLITPTMGWLGKPSVPSLILHSCIFAIAVVGGAIGGYQFAIAMRVFHDSGGAASSGGTLYALDLLGAAIGAVLISTILLPLFGFRSTAALLAFTNLGPVLFLAFSIKDAGLMGHVDQKTPSQ